MNVVIVRQIVFLCVWMVVFGCSDTQRDDVGSSRAVDEVPEDVWFVDQATERGLVFKYAAGNEG